MKPWSETISFKAPLRGAKLKGASASESSVQVLTQAQAREQFELGRIAGERALSEQLLKQRGELHEIFNGVLDSMKNAVPQVVRDTENMMVALALEVAQKLVSGLPISVEMMEAAVRDALTQVRDDSQITVRLHPADLELLQSAGSEVLHQRQTGSDPNAGFRFLGSPEVSRGGCLVQTHFGTVDARRETKLDLIKQSLLT